MVYDVGAGEMNRISFLLPKFTINSEIRWVRCYMSYSSTAPELGLSPYFCSFESLAYLYQAPHKTINIQIPQIPTGDV
jgi:hypothetical protein